MMNNTVNCRCPVCGQPTDKGQLISAELEHLLAACDALGISPDPTGRVTSGEAAALLGCSTKTLADWRQTESGPSFYRGRPARYHLESLADFLIYRRNNTGRAIW